MTGPNEMLFGLQEKSSVPDPRPSSTPTAPLSADTGKIAVAFRRCAEEGRAALVPYICAGYRSREETLELLVAAADAGADVLELGVPFSDPLADGPTIQRASYEALRAGMTVRGVLDLLRAFREERETPVVIFTYLNPILRFGADEFLQAAREAGAQGLLVTDLPAGADPELEGKIRSEALDPILLVAPTTAPGRVEEVSRGGRGFLYYISRTGVTGSRSALRESLAKEVEEVRRRSTLPVAVGFGISSPEQAELVAQWADGVVVGSALVEELDRGGVADAAKFLGALRGAMDRRHAPG